MITQSFTLVSRFEFARIDLAVTSLLIDLAVTSLLVASGSARAASQCQIAAVTPPANLNFSFLSRVSIHLIDFIL